MITVMVGLQGSGKSTKAEEIAEATNAIVLSSDVIRKEHPKWDNAKVFNHLYDQMIMLVNGFENVIIDATNTTMKSRKPIFEALKRAKEPQTVKAYIMTTPIEVCKMRVEERNKDTTSHYVPLEVVDRYLYGFEIPFYEEGFDIIEFDGYGQTIEKDYEKVTAVCNLMVGFDQKNKHHEHTLEKHCAIVHDKIWHTKAPNILLKVAIFHDIGKLFTQTYKEGDPNAHYYNHANVGTYFLLSLLEVLPFGDKATNEEIANTLFYINYHMRPFDWKTEKAHNKWREIFGGTKYKNLLLFNECDQAAC